MEARSDRTCPARTERAFEQTDGLPNSVALTHVSAPTRNEPTEVVTYVLMPPQKIKTFRADSDFSAESYAEEIRSAWRVGISDEAYRLELTTAPPRICIQLRLDYVHRRSTLTTATRLRKGVNSKPQMAVEK